MVFPEEQVGYRKQLKDHINFVSHHLIVVHCQGDGLRGTCALATGIGSLARLAWQLMRTQHYTQVSIRSLGLAAGASIFLRQKSVTTIGPSNVQLAHSISSCHAPKHVMIAS
uniref:Uncharacterized protein n=1 Tax=Plectus sambesii TaxID=2011161 RepID=A0A914VWQ3_9BILA